MSRLQILIGFGKLLVLFTIITISIAIYMTMESVRQLDAVIQNIADENKTAGTR